VKRIKSRGKTCHMSLAAQRSAHEADMTKHGELMCIGCALIICQCLNTNTHTYTLPTFDICLFPTQDHRIHFCISNLVGNKRRWLKCWRRYLSYPKHVWTQRSSTKTWTWGIMAGRENSADLYKTRTACTGVIVIRTLGCFACVLERRNLTDTLLCSLFVRLSRYVSMVLKRCSKNNLIPDQKVLCS
jgi:hypothetical protein